MATANPFGLLGDNDNDDPSLLIAAHQQKNAAKKPTTAPAGAAAAKLPSKPAPPSQAVKDARSNTTPARGGFIVGGGRGGLGRGRGGRGSGSAQVRDDGNGNLNGFLGGYAAGGGEVEEGETGKPLDRDRGFYGGSRPSYHGGRRGGYGNGEDGRDFGHPRRVFERHSGTGRGNEFKREGFGRGNWGNASDDTTAQELDEVAKNEDKAVEKVTEQEVAPVSEGGKEGNDGAVEKDEKEPDDKAVRTPVEAGQKITRFIYNHHIVLAWMRETCGGELLRPAVTRFATNFVALQSLLKHKDGLKQMFRSDRWLQCTYAKSVDGKEVEGIINSANFWDRVNKLVQIIEPLYEVLRVVDGDRRPTIGLVYAKIEAAKRKIQEVSPRYAHLVLSVVEERWERQMSRELHMAAYYLHPAYYYAMELAYEDDLTAAFTRVVERLASSPVEAADAIDQEMTLEEYEKVREEKRKVLLSMKAEERKVDFDKDFGSMQQLSLKKGNGEIFVKLGSDKDSKRKDNADRDERVKKSVSINEFLKPADGERYYSGGRGRGRGRGDRGQFMGGFGGGGNNDITTMAPAINDPGHFPTLGGKQ